MKRKFIIRRNADNSSAPDEFDVDFENAIVTIGSDPAATICLVGVAHEQAVVIDEINQPLLINRAVGTRLNGVLLSEQARRPLAHGDVLDFGDYVIDFVSEERISTLNDSSTLIEDQTETPRPPQLEAADAPDELLVPSATATPFDERPPKPARGFAALLDELRSEEDTFHFIIKDGTQTGGRLNVEAPETLLGWNAGGDFVRHDDDEPASTLCAVVSKSWSGVIMQPQDDATLFVNKNKVDASRRLRNGDQVLLRSGDASRETTLVFHEPASLLVLDSLLPAELPPPVAKDNKPVVERNNDDGNAAVSRTIETPPQSNAAPAKRKSPAPPKLLLGKFTTIELAVLLIGTLIATAIMYAILDLMS